MYSDVVYLLNIFQTSGKLEKAEILEMTVEYLRAIQATELGIRVENGKYLKS